MARKEIPKKFIVLAAGGMAVLGITSLLYDLGGQSFLKGSESGFVPVSGFETYFLFVIILAPIGCVLLLAGVIGIMEKLFPREEP